MPRKIYEEWITFRAFNIPGNEDCQAGIFRCGHCEADMQITLPMGINDLWALASAFGNIHKKCEESE